MYLSFILLAEPLTAEGGEETGVPGENPWRRASNWRMSTTILTGQIATMPPIVTEDRGDWERTSLLVSDGELFQRSDSLGFPRGKRNNGNAGSCYLHLTVIKGHA